MVFPCCVSVVDGAGGDGVVSLLVHVVRCRIMCHWFLSVVSLFMQESPTGLPHVVLDTRPATLWDNVKDSAFIHIHTYMFTFIYIYICDYYMHVSIANVNP